MGQRLDLQEILEVILGTDAVYFQPPSNVQMVYPCIVYARDAGSTKFAANRPYNYKQRYQVILIDRNPDNSVIQTMAMVPLCLYDRHYVSDNLHHDVFNVYY